MIDEDDEEQGGQVFLKFKACLIPSHGRDPLSRVCIDRECSTRGLVCYTCEKQTHSNHLTTSLYEFLSSIKLETPEQQKASFIGKFEREIDSIERRLMESIREVGQSISAQLERIRILASASFTHVRQQTILNIKSQGVNFERQPFAYNLELKTSELNKRLQQYLNGNESPTPELEMRLGGFREISGSLEGKLKQLRDILEQTIKGQRVLLENWCTPAANSAAPAVLQPAMSLSGVSEQASSNQVVIPLAAISRAAPHNPIAQPRIPQQPVTQKAASQRTSQRASKTSSSRMEAEDELLFAMDVPMNTLSLEEPNRPKPDPPAQPQTIHSTKSITQSQKAIPKLEPENEKSATVHPTNEPPSKQIAPTQSQKLVSSVPKPPTQQYTWSQENKAYSIELTKNFTEASRFLYDSKNLAGVLANQRAGKWALRLYQEVGPIMVGICINSKVAAKKYESSPGWGAIGHGNYLVGTDGYTFSHSVARANHSKSEFVFSQKQTILLHFIFNPTLSRLIIECKKKGMQIDFEVPFFDEGYRPCVYLMSSRDKVELLDYSVTE